MSNGWIYLHRKIADNKLWWSEKFNRAQAWIDLILLANHKTGFIYVRGNKIEIKRGQLGWSQDKLAERWKWSRGKVRRYLNDLEMEQQIEQQKSVILSLIIIVNYEKYQSKKPTDDTTDDTTDGRQTIQQTDTNKECIRNDNKEKKLASCADNFEKSVWEELCQFIGKADDKLALWEKYTPDQINEATEKAAKQTKKEYSEIRLGYVIKILSDYDQ